MEQITLYFKEGSSDKVYQAAIESKDGGFVVNFAYGRRGATLTTGSKTSAPVAHDEAKRIFDKLVTEKTAKGYISDGSDHFSQVLTGNEGRSSGILPQLLNPVDEDRLDHLLLSPAYCMQEKYDGRRLLIKKSGSTITGINRLGLTVGLPQRLIDSVEGITGDFIMDGESIGDQFHAFDILSFNCQAMQNWSYQDRYLQLLDIIGSNQCPCIRLVKTAFLPGLKKSMFDQLKAQNKEGVVFKRLDALYVAGRPASGGPQLKFKFYETASFIVTRINDKRSVSLILFNGDKMVPAGNATIPANHNIAVIGAVVECRYLYAFKESGSIYQPVYLGVRDDIRAEQCTVGQLKYKAEAIESAAA